MAYRQNLVDKFTLKLTIFEKRYCAVCGCPIKVKIQNKGVPLTNPYELLCEYHQEVVNIIMDGFQQMKGTSSWKYGPSSEFERGGWKDFIKDNMEILIDQFEDFPERKRFYYPPRDYTSIRGRQVCT